MGNTNLSSCVRLGSKLKQLPILNTQDDCAVVVDNRDGYFSPEDLTALIEKFPEKKEWETQKLNLESSGSNERKSRNIKWKEAEVIGHGSFGKVVLGFNLENGELMAVKQVHIGGGFKSETVRNRIRDLESEIDLLRQFSHKNIVRYIGSSRDDSVFNIFLEYVAGGTISNLLEKYGKFNETLIRVYVKQILEGLEYLHARNTIHRDIKGANILVDNNGVCKLADFGSAKRVYTLIEGEQMNSLKGTVNWMAPEVVLQKELGRFSDIWSVGCLVIEMATGRPPWSSGNQLTTLFQIAKAKNPPPFPKELSPECQDFLRQCFRKNPRERANVTKLLRHRFIADIEIPSKIPDTGAEDNTSAANKKKLANSKKNAAKPDANLESEGLPKKFSTAPDPRNREYATRIETFKSLRHPAEEEKVSSRPEKKLEPLSPSKAKLPKFEYSMENSRAKESISKISQHSITRGNTTRKSKKGEIEFDSIEYLPNGGEDHDNEHQDSKLTASQKKYLPSNSLSESQKVKDKSNSMSSSGKKIYKSLKEEEEERRAKPKAANLLVVRVATNSTRGLRTGLLDAQEFENQFPENLPIENDAHLTIKENPNEEEAHVTPLNQSHDLAHENRGRRSVKYKSFSEAHISSPTQNSNPTDGPPQKNHGNDSFENDNMHQTAEGVTNGPLHHHPNVSVAHSSFRREKEEEIEMNFSRIQFTDNHLIENHRMGESAKNSQVHRIKSAHEKQNSDFWHWSFCNKL